MDIHSAAEEEAFLKNLDSYFDRAMVVTLYFIRENASGYLSRIEGRVRRFELSNCRNTKLSWEYDPLFPSTPTYPLGFLKMRLKLIPTATEKVDGKGRNIP